MPTDPARTNLVEVTNTLYTRRKTPNQLVHDLINSLEKQVGLTHHI